MNAPLNIPGYKVIKPLGKGGMAEVYLAEQESLGRQVAIKILDEHSSDPGFADRFLQEARIVAAMNHANVITVHDFGQLDDRRLFIAMELVEGGDLDLKIENGVTENEAVEITKDLLKALAFIHSQSIIHRDIKPANILFRADGTLLLTDFGVAKQENQDANLTQSGTAVGSPAYCSPEQSMGQDLDGRTDIYSVGVVFLEMLMGANPYKTDSSMQTSINHIQMDVPKLTDDLKKYQSFVERMLAKDPNSRFSSTNEAKDFLESLDQQKSGSYADKSDANYSVKSGAGALKDPVFLKTIIVTVAVVGITLAGYFIKQKIEFNQELNRLVELGDSRFDDSRYISPTNDSALYYYQQVLNLDPNNSDAEAGIKNIANHYYGIATGAFAENNSRKFRAAVKAGLLADPNNADLLEINEAYEASRDNKQKVVDKLFDLFE